MQRKSFTSGASKLPEGKGDARVMPGAWGIAGGKGTFVTAGYMTFAATSDFGKTFDAFGMWGKFKDDARGKLSTHHVGAVYCGDASGRFLALGDNRGDSGPKFGNLFASDDAGKTWKWLTPKGLDASTGRGTLECNGSGGTMSTVTDLVHYYDMLLSGAGGLPPEQANIIVGDLAQSTPTAPDGMVPGGVYPQRFGIPEGLYAEPVAVKQGWMCCIGADWMHLSTGVIGLDRRYVMAISSMQAADADDARATITQAVKTMFPGGRI